MLKKLKKLTLVLVFAFTLILALVIFLGFRGMKTMQWGMAETLRWHSDGLSRRFYIDAALNEKMAEVVEQAAVEIESGKVWFWKGADILRAFNDGPVFYSLLHLCFNKRLNEIRADSSIVASLPDETFNRFFAAAAAGKIASDSLSTIRQMLVEEVSVNVGTPVGLVIPENLEVFKENLSDEEILQCSELMLEACAGLASQSFPAPPDIIVELKKIISND
jgi:hypothetical protein